MQNQKALNALATFQGPKLDDLISNLEDNKESKPSNVVASDVKDVTADFLAPVEKPQNSTPDSPIIVYKGILRRLAGMRPLNTTTAILAGQQESVGQVIISDDLDSTLQIPELLSHWKKHNHEALGLVVFNDITNPEDYKGSMLKLLKPTGSQKRLLLLAMTGSIHPNAWLATCDDIKSSAFTWSSVRVGHQTGNRRRNEKLAFVHASKIGVSFDDEVPHGVQTKCVCNCENVKGSAVRICLNPTNNKHHSTYCT